MQQVLLVDGVCTELIRSRASNPYQIKIVQGVYESARQEPVDVMPIVSIDDQPPSKASSRRKSDYFPSNERVGLLGW
jgi:hypothetical protein